MNNYISVEVFIENDISGDWGKEFPDEKHKTKVFCVRGADINDLNIGKIENLPVRYVKEASKDKFLEKGNIIIEISGGSPTQSTGRVTFLENIDREVVCSNFCRALKIKKEYSPKYVFYLLQNIYNSGVFFNFESKTSGIKNLLYNSAFENIKVPNRDYSSQQKIENVITVIDKKIQLLHQINDNLAELAKTIYDYWFVQFDFPDENGKPYKTSGGKMVYNEVLKREIPEGWEVKKLGEVIEKISNNILPTEYQNLNYLPIDFLPKRQFYYDKYDLRENALSSLIKFDEDDILLGAMRVYFHRVCNAIEDGISRNTIFVLRPFEKENKNYCLFLLDEEKTIQFANDNSTGSSIPYAKWDNGLANYQLVLPKKNILSLFNLKINPIIKKLKINSKQIQHLRSLRDWLLPMLMNGQISVE